MNAGNLEAILALQLARCIMEYQAFRRFQKMQRKRQAQGFY